MWGITSGQTQYRWFARTLAESKAKYKFVFTHHVLGTGRGAIELADLYEWGGRNRAGAWEFDQKRAGWEFPIHQLMVKYGVTIFFQGHDHLFAHQQKDGVVDQEIPICDNTYTAFNREAYRSGDILPNSGYLRVSVSAAGVKVDGTFAYLLPQDQPPGHKNGELAFSYTVPPRFVRDGKVGQISVARC